MTGFLGATMTNDDRSMIRKLVDHYRAEMVECDRIIEETKKRRERARGCSPKSVADKFEIRLSDVYHAIK